MATYHFDVEGDEERSEADLLDDAAAWVQLVMLSGEILKDLDGKLPPHADIMLAVRQGERLVADIRVSANRYSQFPQA